MAPPDATPKNLFPGAPAASAGPAPGAFATPAPGAFATPATVEFPHETEPEDADISAFGNRVQADQDLAMIDARVSHVRDVRYGRGAPQPDAFPVAPVTPVARTRERAGRGMVVAILAGSAVGLLVAAAGLSLFLLLTR